MRIPFFIFVGCNTQREIEIVMKMEMMKIDIKGCLVDEREVFLRQCIGGKKCRR